MESIAGALLVVFIVLKLTGVITWSWLWVLAPFWIPLAIVVLLFVVWIVTIGIIALFSSIR